MTHTEFDSLKEKLAEMPSEALAAFIAEIAVTNDRVLEAVEMFVERANPSKLIAALRKQLRAIERNKRFYHYREARTLVKRLDDWLDRIEQDLIPQDPAAAIELLAAFFQADAAIYEHVDDSDGAVGMCFRRAAAIMADASIKAGRPPSAGRWLRELLQSNDYGVRDRLYDHAGSLMAEDQIRALIETWRAELANETSSDASNYQRISLRARCAQFAKAIPDPELFAEIRLEGRSPNELPAVAIDVAERFLDAGQPERAREFLPKERQEFWNHQIDKLKIRIHQELGESEAINEIRWQQFCNYPSETSAREYLNLLPAAEHESSLKRMRAVVDGGDYSWRNKAQCYLDWNDPSAAAAMVESHREEARQTDYYTQSEMAGRLAKSHPRAATILLRGAAEATVAQSNSKHYGHAVRYIRQLEPLAKEIQDWGGLPPHDEWWHAWLYLRDRRENGAWG